MRSGNKVPTFKMMGSSPLTMPGHGAPANHKHSKNDPDNWTAQEVTKDKDGTTRINNSSGTVGKKGTTTTTPGKTTTTTPKVSKTPSTKKEGSVPGNTASTSDKPKMSNAEWTKFLKDNPGWSAEKETKPKTTTTKPVTTTTKPVTTTTPDTPDTREDKVLSAGPGKGAVTGNVNFNTAKKKGPVRKFLDRLKEGRQIKKNGEKKCGPKDDCAAYG